LLNISTEIRDIRKRYNEKWETFEFWLLLAIAVLIFFEWKYPAEQLDHIAISVALGLALIKKASGRVVHYLVVKRDHTGISKLRKQALLKWLATPLSIENVRFASFEGDETFGSKSEIKSYSAVLNRIVDREEAEHPFTSEHRADLYRRWLYSRQSVLSAYVDDNGQPLAAAVVIPLTKSAYEQYKAGSLDALDIQLHHILGPGQVPYKYLLVDAVAGPKFDLRLLASRLALYHCSIFFDPYDPPVVVFSTTIGRLRDTFAACRFSVTESEWLDGGTDFYLERDFSVINQESTAYDDVQNIFFDVCAAYRRINNTSSVQPIRP
jgi:hypothetical protein